VTSRHDHSRRRRRVVVSPSMSPGHQFLLYKINFKKNVCRAKIDSPKLPCWWIRRNENMRGSRHYFCLRDDVRRDWKKAFNLLDKRWKILELEHKSRFGWCQRSSVGHSNSEILRFQSDTPIIIILILISMRYLQATRFVLCPSS